MSVLGTDALTLADWAKRVDDDGQVAQIVDLLSQENAILQDMPWMMGNQTTGHKTTVRTGLAEGTWRRLYQGVQPTKTTTAQIVDNCGNLEGYSEIDVDLANLNGNTAQFRLSEDAGFLEGMSQQMASAFFYSNSLDTPEQIMGFAPRYNTLNTASAISANVIDAGGTGSTNTSIWLVGWGPQSCFGIFPKGQTAGLNMRDLGEDTLQLADGSRYQVYRSHFKWMSGLCIRDWRYIVRIANIDVEDLDTTNSANLVKLLIKAVHLVPTAPRGVAPVQTATMPSSPITTPRFAFYCNRTINTALDQQIVDKPAGLGGTLMYLDPAMWGGQSVVGFRGIPFRTVDAILNTEDAVTA